MKGFLLALILHQFGGIEALALPAWSDIFSALAPYKDPMQAAADPYLPMASGKELTKEEMEEYGFNPDDQGSPRFGIVQLGNSGTAYNVTLNLTGHILMGLGIASSLVFYLFLTALNDRSAGYDRNDRVKRDLSAVLEREDLTNLDEELLDMAGLLDAFEVQLQERASQHDLVITHPDCFSQSACFLAQSPNWSKEWHKLMHHLQNGLKRNDLETSKKALQYLRSIRFGLKSTRKCANLFPKCNIENMEWMLLQQ